MVLTYVSTWLSLCLHSSYRKVKREGGFNTCLYLAFRLSLHSSYRKVRRGGFKICLYLAFPLSLHSSYGKVRGGGVLTYVSTWLCPCQSSYGKVKRCGGGFNICLYLAFPLFPSVPPFILSQGESGGGGGLTYVYTWLCPCHSTDLIAR